MTASEYHSYRKMWILAFGDPTTCASVRFAAYAVFSLRKNGRLLLLRKAPPTALALAQAGTRSS